MYKLLRDDVSDTKMNDNTVSALKDVKSHTDMDSAYIFREAIMSWTKD